MLVKDYRIEDNLKVVKVIDDSALEEIEKIISKPGYATGTVEVPAMEVESISSERLDQHLVIINYWDVDYEKGYAHKHALCVFKNGDNVRTLTPPVENYKIQFLRRSILFDLYANKLSLKKREELADRNIRYNKRLISNMERMDANDKPIDTYLDEKTAKKFAKKCKNLGEINY